MKYRMTLIALCCAGCHAIQPNTPSLVVPPVAVAPTVVPPAPLPTLPPGPISIDITVSPYNPRKGQVATMSVSAGGGAGAPFTYAWTFGDGASTNGPETSVTHIYRNDGTKEIRVTATDATGKSGTGFRLIDVPSDPTPPSEPPPPTPAPAPPTPAPQPTPAPTLIVSLNCTPMTHGTPTPCNVNAFYSGALPSAAITNVDWDWGDGVTNSTATPVNTRAYVNAGTYIVFAKVTATTVDGTKTATTSKTLTIP